MEQTESVRLVDFLLEIAILVTGLHAFVDFVTEAVDLSDVIQAALELSNCNVTAKELIFPNLNISLVPN